jgi:F-type H+-transporting ATPase subunit gamma
MANILSTKRRILTAQNVSKTTRAMQMIATSKLKRAQDAALSSRSYVEKLTNLTNNLTNRVEDKNKSEYMIEKDIDKALYIVISPDKGLCGGLVTNLIKETLNESDNKKIKYITIGKKIEGPIRKLGKEIIASFEFGTTLPTFDMVYPITKIIDDEFLSGDVSEVKILFSHFLTVFTQIPKTSELLPIKTQVQEDKNESSFTLFEPAVEMILPQVLRHYLEMSVFQYLLESFASEQAARMIAMKNATENATEMIEALKLEYNKQRQEKITNEILDIGSASAFLTYE